MTRMVHGLVPLALALSAASLGAHAATTDGFCGVVLCTPLAPPIATIALSNLDTPVDIPAPGGSLSGPNSTGTIAYGPLQPSVQAESGVGALKPGGLSSNIITSYFHYQVGAASVLPLVGDVFVPVLVQGDYFISASAANNFGTGDAAVLVKVNYSDFVPNSFTADLSSDQCAAGGGGRACDTSGSFTLRGQIKIGVPMSVDMYAIAHSQSFVGLLGQASSLAFIDPLITIDPTFADAANFKLYVSPGVGNTAVPVPGAGLLFAWSLLPVGAATWRARRAGGRGTEKNGRG